MHKLSTVIMTYNEEKLIGQCIDSVKGISDEILLVDSFSSDKTIEIAESLGAKVIQHTFEGFQEQRAYCVQSAKFDLVLALDADEWLSKELSQEISLIKTNSTHDTYKLNRLHKVGEKWLRHGKWSPDYILRLFHKEKVSYGGRVPHDKIIPNEGASTKKLKGTLFHILNENFHERVAKINVQSTESADYSKSIGKRGNMFRVVFKPFLRFLNEYFLRLGFLDGKHGLFMCMTNAYYVFLREVKLME